MISFSNFDLIQNLEYSIKHNDILNFSFDNNYQDIDNNNVSSNIFSDKFLNNEFEQYNSFYNNNIPPYLKP